MLAYRLVNDVNLFQIRSFCPKCHTTLAWYDMIPILSWILLRAKCRSCKRKISILYPFIELSTLIIFLELYDKIPSHYFFSYFIFFSALIVTIRTDIETMLISRFVTIFLIPLAFLFSFLNWLPLTFSQILIGAAFGYFLLYFIEKVFKIITKKQGLGQGDVELLCFIGAFTGITGCWISILIGSILGSIFGIFFIIIDKLNFSNKIPFGPFLAIGSILYVLYQDEILSLIFRI